MIVLARFTIASRRLVLFELVELEAATRQATSKGAEYAELGAEHAEQAAGRLLAPAALRQTGRYDRSRLAVVDCSTVIANWLLAHLASNVDRFVRKALPTASTVIGRRWCWLHHRPGLQFGIRVCGIVR